MPRLPRALTQALAAALLAFCLQPAVAQESPPAAQSPPSAADAPAPARFNFILTEGKNRPAGEPRKEDLRVTVGGVEQTVAAVTRDESPLSYGLVVDNSGSMRTQFHAVIAAAKFIVAQGRPEDEGFVVRFVASDQIKLLHDFTPDHAGLGRALDAMYVEGGQTAIIDALHLSAEHFAKQAKGAPAPPRRRALILITDGEERSSYYKLEQLVDLLREEEIRVFCVGLTGALEKTSGFVMPSRREKAELLLTRVARETGGRAFFATKVGELKEAVEQIAGHLRAEYVVEFVPSGKEGRPASGKLEVKLAGDAGKSGRAVIHRPWSIKAGRPDAKK